MRYRIDLLIPASTTETAPTKQDIIVWKGVISHVQMLFPKGCAGLAHARIRQANHNIAPVNPNGWFTGDGSGPDYQEYFPLESGTNEITIEGYNEDEIYAHTPIVEFDVLPEEVLRMPKIQYDLVYAFIRAVEAMNLVLAKFGVT